MYTQCPECLSVFSLDAPTLAKAHGHVVCGHCHASFGSLATLTEQLPPEPFVELAINEPALEPPLLDLVVYRPQPEPAVVAIEPVAGALPDDFSQLVFAPRFAREPRGRRAGKRARGKPHRTRAASGERHWPWVLACSVLALLLLAQLAWAKRDTLIRDPAVGGWLRSSCAALHCRLPLVAAPTLLRLLASNVQTHHREVDGATAKASVATPVRRGGAGAGLRGLTR
ncbi:Zinc finger/thioredoxin putative domain-containing protein OS=Rhodanobacter lindaniclasticus OX=75310 GN=B1991_05830 PE=4 SV=1 [Rhodanobacter lindaniclasticus]